VVLHHRGFFTFYPSVNAETMLDLGYCLLTAAAALLGGVLFIFLLLLRTWGRMEDTANLMFSISVDLANGISATKRNGTVLQDSTKELGTSTRTNASAVKPAAG
jgi:hypothetical protein